MRRKVCVAITARSSYSRIKTALRSILLNPKLELQLVLAASVLLERYGNVFKEIRDDGFNIKAKLYTALEGGNPVTSVKTTGLGIIELATVFDNLNPDLVVTIADRYETMATALAAAYMNIPLVHIQGGEVTGSIDEKVRHAVTKLADYHFVATKKAAERVIKMGEEPSRVIQTGCPSIDLAAEIIKNPSLDFNLIERYGGVGTRLDSFKEYLIVLQHPVTTEYKNARNQVNETLKAIKELELPTFWFWPNIDTGSNETSHGIRAFREIEKPDNIWFFKNMSPEDFLKVLYSSKGIIGNSSVAIRECAYLGVPAVNIGNRQIGRERGPNVIDVDYSKDAIINAVKCHLKNGKYQSCSLYGDGKAGERIANMLVKIPLVYQKRLTY